MSSFMRQQNRRQSMMRKAALLLFLPLASTAFVTPSKSAKTRSPTSFVIPQHRLQSSNGDGGESTDVATTSRRKRRKDGLDPEMRSKLLSESIAPWRTVRLFLYASAGSGALLGGLITLSGVAAALSGARTDTDFNAEVGDSL